MKIKSLLLAMGLTLVAAPTMAEVGVSISVGEPGFYGQIDIGSFPQPRLIYRRPILVERVTVVQEPLYLHVPPGHARNWHRYCRNYGACGRPAYFVQDRWYNDVYVPHYREVRRDRDDHDGDRDHHDNGEHGKHKKHKD